MHSPKIIAFVGSVRNLPLARRGNCPLGAGLYSYERISRLGVLSMRSTCGAGALDFRDFSGLLGEKENRIGIAQTLPFHPQTPFSLN